MSEIANDHFNDPASQYPKAPVKYFFLDVPNLYTTRNKLTGNPRIVKFDPYLFLMKGMDIPTPSYWTLDELATKDKRFKEFKKKRPTTAAILTKEDSLIDMRDMVISSDFDDDQAGRMILHIIEGNRQAKQFTGIHHLPWPLPDYVVNFQVVDPPDANGVCTATFELKESNGKFLQKENASTLFPHHWSKQQLYDECLYALKHKQRIVDSSTGYMSHTLCGIPVEIHFDPAGSKIRTLYPIRIPDVD